MTKKQRNLWLAVAGVALIQAAVLGWMIYDRARLLADGREIVLEVVPVDPRDLFRGDYVTLNYDISRVPAPTDGKPMRGEDIYITLQKNPEGRWTAVHADTTPPAATGPEQVVLKGKARFSYAATEQRPAEVGVLYGIERFFVSEGKGHEIEQLVGDRKLFALIAVDEDGNAGIKGLIVDGKRVYEEPLI